MNHLIPDHMMLLQEINKLRARVRELEEWVLMLRAASGDQGTGGSWTDVGREFAPARRGNTK